MTEPQDFFSLLMRDRMVPQYIGTRRGAPFPLGMVTRRTAWFAMACLFASTELFMLGRIWTFERGYFRSDFGMSISMSVLGAGMNKPHSDTHNESGLSSRFLREEFEYAVSRLW